MFLIVAQSEQVDTTGKGQRETDESRSRSVSGMPQIASRSTFSATFTREGAISLATMREDSRADWKIIIVKTQRNGGE